MNSAFREGMSELYSSLNFVDLNEKQWYISGDKYYLRIYYH